MPRLELAPDRAASCPMRRGPAEDRIAELERLRSPGAPSASCHDSTARGRVGVERLVDGHPARVVSELDEVPLELLDVGAVGDARRRGAATAASPVEETAPAAFT